MQPGFVHICAFLLLLGKSATAYIDKNTINYIWMYLNEETSGKP